MSRQEYCGYYIDCFGGKDCIDSDGIPYADVIKVFYRDTDMFPEEDIQSVQEAHELIDELIDDASRQFFERLPDFGKPLPDNVIQFPGRTA